MNETPPRLPYRCGTMWLAMTSEERGRYVEAILRAESEYVFWVRAHPRPDPEWLKKAKRVEDGWSWEMAANDPNGFVANAYSSILPDPTRAP